MQSRIRNIRELMERKPRASLGFFPTPFYKLEHMSAELGVELYIKRDDFSGMSLFGGNKIRKLEYLMGDALDKGCDTVFTYGATQSNHAMQTVTAARRLGLAPILYLNAYVEPDENDIRSNMLLDRVMGAQMHIVRSLDGETEAQTEERCVLLGRAHAQRLEAQGHKCYDIPLGGASVVGSAGFIGGYAELMEQCAALDFRADALYLATGTGGTLAGLAAGRALMGGGPKIVGVAVSEKSPEYEEKCVRLANGALQWLGAAGRVSASDFRVERGYFAPGYERPNARATRAIQLLARTEGLLADPVYTGKALAGLLGAVESGEIQKGSRVVFWHTGGATALFAEREILGDLSRA